jgi:HEAT repeat protein
MRRDICILLVLIFSNVVATAQAPLRSDPPISPRVVNTLLDGLASENAGVQRSCALMLGHLQCGRSRIALMNVLRNGPDERCRAAAAWALCRIGDPSGLMVVRSTAEKDESLRLRAICAWYYREVQQGRDLSAQGSESTRNL